MDFNLSHQQEDWPSLLPWLACVREFEGEVVRPTVTQGPWRVGREEDAILVVRLEGWEKAKGPPSLTVRLEVEIEMGERRREGWPSLLP